MCLTYILINPLNAELNPICHLLALLGAPHILHISRIRVKVLSTNTIIEKKLLIFHDTSAVICQGILL